MTDYARLLAQIKRTWSIEEKVRAVDAADIVEWIIRLEDQVEAIEERNDDLYHALVNLIAVIPFDLDETQRAVVADAHEVLNIYER